ncbi:putative fibroblast growth factor 1 [Syngnathoides biaculeatus]|uniref:putative fibroblast growth factor 1 n=1 Tax=Syngnathoides biaculeatus TaxID=300417 RepID=UPI002ADE3178|nr:putative fibroblast growth factor 1 [Syngnathoides biaculeatus]XP_061660268.1 putative fibroblast growth factor 1 [Syngnathoides biaculeatus]
MSAEGSASASHHEPQSLGRMSEGNVIRLPSASLDLFTHERRALTRLHCLNGGYQLRILPDGIVNGGRLHNDPYDILRLQATNVGVVVVTGEHTGRYLAMNNKGGLYGSLTLNDECYFLEKYEENHYNTYQSQKYEWYVALKKNGKPKPGPKATARQKAIFFLPRSADARLGASETGRQDQPDFCVYR